MKNKKILKFLLGSIALALGVSTITFNNLEQPKEQLAPLSAWSGEVISTEGNYYDSVKGLEGNALKNKLSSICQPSNKGYDWLVKDADEAEGHPNDILCIYYRFRIPKDKDGQSTSASNFMFNREHVWPQSKLTSAKNDRHNYYASESKINGIRSNNPFGEVSHTEDNRVSFWGVDSNCFTASGKFEPCDEAKGEVARAVMYDSLVYNVPITGIFSSVDLCLSWHEQFPVTNREIYRNNIIFEKQKNRNPFIDHPEYANGCFGDGTVGPKEPTIKIDESLTVEKDDSKYVNAQILHGKGTITFTSLNEDIATVSNDGKVTGIEVGNTDIVASAMVDGKHIESTCHVTVKAPVTLISLNINPSSLTLEENHEKALTVTPTPSDANGSVTWKSLNPDIASVDANGKVKGVAIGEAIIEATSIKFPTIKATCAVNVIEEIPLVGFELVTSKDQLEPGKYVIACDDKVFASSLAELDGTDNYKSYLFTEPNIIETKAEADEFEFIGDNTNGFYLKTKQNTYISGSSGKNALNVCTTEAEAHPNEITFENGNAIIEDKVAGTIIKFNKDSSQMRFRYYKTSSSQAAVKLYKKGSGTPTPSEYSLAQFNSDFVNTVICDNGVTPPDVVTFNSLENKYNKLKAEDKEYLKTATSKDPIVGPAVAKYDGILARYGTSEYNNFLQREIKLGGNPNITICKGDNVILYTALSVAGLLTVLTLTIVIVKRKKRVN